VLVCLDASLHQSLMPISSSADENRYGGSTRLPVSNISSAVATTSSTCDPRQLQYVPIVYVDEDGTPTCYEVIQPVPSPSYFSTSGPPSSAQNAGLSDCRFIPEFELDGINSGSWFRCLPIRIYH